MEDSSAQLTKSLATIAELEPLETRRQQAEELAAALRGWFDCDFSVVDAQRGEVVLRDSRSPVEELDLLFELARSVAAGGNAEFLAEEDPVLVLAVPCADAHGASLVAVAPFVSRPLTIGEDLSGPMRLLGLSHEQTLAWIERQVVWQPHMLLRLAQAVVQKQHAETEVARLRQEVDSVSDNLASTYEEISLLYGVTQNLRLSSSVLELGRQALDGLWEVVPAAGLAIQYLPDEDDAGQVGMHDQAPSHLIEFGDCPVDAGEFNSLIEQLRISPLSGPVIANQIITSQPMWKFPAIRELIVVPLAQGGKVFGWMAAFNHRQGHEFGTVEASLLSSLAAILGIHSGNIDLYRQQGRFLASVVRALTSAIDAKDPYTCGHSDRVARVSVQLAQQLGLDGATVNTIYMAGLLHDIGKIGIDDNVLRKPGRLTDAEFEHIKMHPTLGHKILKDIKEFRDVLPVVLHHHESWDGTGYPHGLKGEEIPRLARIAAVADAFDAMSSDRPYRKGMPDEKVDAIFRGGAGQQWDAEVVEAFFTVRDEIREISKHERVELTLDVQQWT